MLTLESDHVDGIGALTPGAPIGCGIMGWLRLCSGYRGEDGDHQVRFCTASIAVQLRGPHLPPQRVPACKGSQSQLAHLMAVNNFESQSLTYFSMSLFNMQIAPLHQTI